MQLSHLLVAKAQKLEEIEVVVNAFFADKIDTEKVKEQEENTDLGETRHLNWDI
jgi:hypothetical protein